MPELRLKAMREILTRRILGLFGGSPSGFYGVGGRDLFAEFHGLGELGSGGSVVELFALLNAIAGVAKGVEIFKDLRIVEGVVDGDLGFA